jgi:hypothetical protein
LRFAEFGEKEVIVSLEEAITILSKWKGDSATILLAAESLLRMHLRGIHNAGVDWTFGIRGRVAQVESLAGSTPMAFVDTSALEVIERLPGWYGRYFHSSSMTFAHYDFKRGSTIHEHFHPQEEVYEVIEGELELTIDGVKQVARPGVVGIRAEQRPLLS